MNKTITALRNSIFLSIISKSNQCFNNSIFCHRKSVGLNFKKKALEICFGASFKFIKVLNKNNKKIIRLSFIVISRY